MKNILKKFTSRKFLVTVAGIIAGLVTAFLGEADTVERIAGCMVTAVSSLGYCFAEATVDARK